MSEGDVWVGGDIHKDKPFIRVVIEHTAVNMPPECEDAAYRETCRWVDDAMKPHIADKGYEWEYHISENERRLWKINGLIPPPCKWYFCLKVRVRLLICASLGKSEEEQKWIQANKTLPWAGDH